MTAHLTVPRTEPEVVEPKRRSGIWKLAVFVIVIAGAGAGAYYSGLNKAKMSYRHSEVGSFHEADELHESTPLTEPGHPRRSKTSREQSPGTDSPAERMVDQETAIGFEFTEVESPDQADPPGTGPAGTADDTTTITKIRPRFGHRESRPSTSRLETRSRRGMRSSSSAAPTWQTPRPTSRPSMSSGSTI